MKFRPRVNRSGVNWFLLSPRPCPLLPWKVRQEVLPKGQWTFIVPYGIMSQTTILFNRIQAYSQKDRTCSNIGCQREQCQHECEGWAIKLALALRPSVVYSPSAPWTMVRHTARKQETCVNTSELFSGLWVPEVGTAGGLLWARQWILLGISWIAKRLEASQGRMSMDFVSYLLSK
jgi:hypothetical protein